MGQVTNFQAKVTRHDTLDTTAFCVFYTLPHHIHPSMIFYLNTNGWTSSKLDALVFETRESAQLVADKLNEK